MFERVSVMSILFNRKLFKRLAFAAVLACFFAAASPVAARDGFGGFEGTGVSSGEERSRILLAFPDYAASKSGSRNRALLEYQEYVFVTGEPVLLKGTLTIEKTVKNDIVITRYTYLLNNFARGFQLTRETEYETTSTVKSDGQIVTETVVTRVPSRVPTEKIVTDGHTYTLRRFEFTRTSLIDVRPAVQYYSGNTWYRKQYEVGGGVVTSSSGDYLYVEATGGFVGFDEAWGEADIETTEYLISYTQNYMSDWGGGTRELWSGVANVKRAQSLATDLRYIDNEPDAISFRGGYLETRSNDNLLEISARMPEFDEVGNSTDRIKNYTDSTQISTFPYTKRLVSPDVKQVRGHWSEAAIERLFGLEILNARPSEYEPDQYITRAEFAGMIVAAAKPIPSDPLIVQNNKKKIAKKSKDEPPPSFTDVPADHEYYAQIEEAFARGMMAPIDKNEFRPNEKMVVSDAAVAFIRALGLEAVVSANGAITEFPDDTIIPAYARDALYIAQKIGLLRGDETGKINPLKELTNAEAAVMVDRFVAYMGHEIKADYREHIMDY